MPQALRMTRSAMTASLSDLGKLQHFAGLNNSTRNKKLNQLGENFKHRACGFGAHNDFLSGAGFSPSRRLPTRDTELVEELPAREQLTAPLFCDDEGGAAFSFLQRGAR